MRGKAGLALWVAVTVGSIGAQAADAATLTGEVSSNGTPVGRAFVAAIGPNGRAAATSDSAGRFSLSLPDGTYRIAANASGYAAAIENGVTVSGTTNANVILSPSGTSLLPVPVYGGGSAVAADGTPGVFYLTGGNVGDLFRSTDWGGTWTRVTQINDDPAYGLPGSSYPQSLTTSGYPGEVAAVLTPGGVFYSNDYGVTWNIIANSPASAYPPSILWGHAGGTSVIVLITGYPTPTYYVADMSAPYPTFVRMTTPYTSTAQPVTVANGADGPWLATVDSSGTASVFPLTASADAPSPTQTLSVPLKEPEAIALGGASSGGNPPSTIVVNSTYEVAMTMKEPGAGAYPPPVTSTMDADNCMKGGFGTGFASSPPVITPNSSGTYSAAWAGGCWVQDVGGALTVSPDGGNGAAIDAGYDATHASRGSDAVVLLAPPIPVVITGSDARGVMKLADDNGGAPVPLTDGTVAASPGTAASSAGIATDGITAATVNQTIFGPALGEIASATDVGGVASVDAGADFHLAVYQSVGAAGWWQGATGSWLLFGLNPYGGGRALLAGFENWSPSTPAAAGANVGGEPLSIVNGQRGAPAPAVIYSIVGVTGQDEALVDAEIGGLSGLVRITLGPGPTLTNVTTIAPNVITESGPMTYCSKTGSAAALGDVALAIGQGQNGDTLYRVTDATTDGPAVTEVADLPGQGDGFGLPALQTDCAAGIVVAASGVPGGGLLISTDGGQTFTTLPYTDPGGGIASIRAIALTLGPPAAILVGDAEGYIQRSSDGGKTWTVANDPTNGVNLSVTGNLTGITDLTSWVGGPSSAGDGGVLAATDPFAGTNFVAGPGELTGRLIAGAHSTLPVISSFRLTRTRFRTGGRPIAAFARAKRHRRHHMQAPRGTTFAFSVTEPGAVTILFARTHSGQLERGRCVATTKRVSKKRRCTAYTVARTGLVRRVTPGTHRVAFAGRIRRTTLKPGTYLAVIVAQTPNGRRSAARTATFTIVKR